MSKRKQYKPEFKAKVALEVLKGEQTMSEQASRFGVHPTIIHQWKKALLEGAPELFEGGSSAKEPVVAEANVQALHAKIGSPSLVRKAQTVGRQVRRSMVERSRSDLSVIRQCRLLSISCSTFYAPPSSESDENLAIMAKIDRQFLDTPVSGIRFKPSSPLPGPIRSSSSISTDTSPTDNEKPPFVDIS